MGETVLTMADNNYAISNLRTIKENHGIRKAYKTICKRICLEPELPKENDCVFRPTYYEWHLTDGNGRVLLCWVDPADSLYIYNDEDGNELDEPQAMDYEQVLSECEDYIKSGKEFFKFADDDDEREGFHGVRRREWDRLPDNAAEIMARALYDYYCYEPVLAK